MLLVEPVFYWINHGHVIKHYKWNFFSNKKQFQTDLVEISKFTGIQSVLILSTRPTVLPFGLFVRGFSSLSQSV